MNRDAGSRNLHDGRAAFIVVALAVMALSLGRASRAQNPAKSPAQAPQPMEPAEQVFKNIQVLNGTRAAELQGTMSFVASSLGVDCDYCHIQAFEDDHSKSKVRARDMIRMVQRINQETFHGENVVNCFTCHQGSTAPVSIATVFASNAPRPTPPPAAAVNGGTPPSVQEVLDHYVKALGGQAGLDAVKTRVIKTASLTRPSVAGAYDEIYQKAPGKVMRLHTSGGYSISTGYNGNRAWSEDSEKSYWGLLNTSQLHATLRDSEMYPGSRISREYRDAVVSGKEKVGDREAFVITGTSPEGVREKFYFDVQNGLLLRRHSEEPTQFGWFPLDTNFEGYREVDGVKLPFVVRVASAGGAFGVRTSYMIVEVHQNVPIDDAKFERAPKTP